MLGVKYAKYIIYDSTSYRYGAPGLKKIRMYDMGTTVPPNEKLYIYCARFGPYFYSTSLKTIITFKISMQFTTNTLSLLSSDSF